MTDKERAIVVFLGFVIVFFGGLQYVGQIFLAPATTTHINDNVLGNEKNTAPPPCSTGNDAPCNIPPELNHNQTNSDLNIASFSDADMKQGWYWGSLDQKKPGTPAMWLHKGEGTRNAEWYDPKTDYCDVFASSTFSSVNKYEGGLGPNGPEMGYWTIKFSEGTTLNNYGKLTFEWQHSDVVESGTFTCVKNILNVTFRDHASTATYDSIKQVLVWEGIDYKKTK